MPAAFRFHAHEGQRHGKLAVDQVLQLAGQPEVIQGEAPDDDVGPQDLLDDRPHVVMDAAFAGRLAPAGKAAQARLDIKRADAKGFDCRRLLAPVFCPSDNPIKKSAGQAPGIATFALRAAVDCQNIHRALLTSAAHRHTRSIRPCRLLRPNLRPPSSTGFATFAAKLGLPAKMAQPPRESRSFCTLSVYAVHRMPKEARGVISR